MAFEYLILALLITPVGKLLKTASFNVYRRVFGVWAFLFASAHAFTYFGMEYQYQGTPFVAKHFLELDVASGTVAFVIIAALGLTSNNASVRFLKASWKKLQSLAYPLFLITVLHVAFASRFDAFYMVSIAILVLVRTFAYLSESSGKPAAVAGKSANG